MIRGPLMVVLIALFAVLLAPSALALEADGAPQRIGAGTGEKVAIAVTLQPNSYQSFFIDLPSNVATLRVLTTGASGNVDLFVKPGVPHSATSLVALQAESAYSAASAGANETLDASRNSTPPLRPGRWWITPANATGTTVTLTLDVTSTSQGAPFQITAGMSGAYFDPDKIYQGFFFEVLDATTALATWFTYTPNGQQAYMIGVGTISGDRVQITELIKTRGARFGDAFDASAVVREDWGDLTFVFDTCGTGYAEYLPSQAATQAAWPIDELVLTRLTSIAGLGCPATASAGTGAKFLLGGTSGAWFDPNRSGEGWLIEVLNPTTAFVYWFSYTPTGEQAWFGNIGTIVDGGIRIADAIQPSGGRFGPNYDPAQVTLQPWGEYALTFTDCNFAVMAAVGPPAYGAYGSSNLARLTALAGTNPCAFGAQPFTLSGTARAASNMHADGDPNNPETPNRDNDTPAQEQTLVNPAIVAGFLATTATGVPGDRFQSSTDAFDVYTVTLAQGQMVRLAISDHDGANPTAIDFDLFLFPANDATAPIASSEGTGPLEQIVAPASGQFDIVLLGFRGSGNYVLTIDNVAAVAQSIEGTMSSLHEMVADEVVVDWGDADGVGDVRAKSAAAGVELLAGAEGRPVLVSTRNAKARGLAVRESPFATKGAGWGIANPKTRAAHDVIRHVKALRAVPGVRDAAPNHIARIKAVPNDPIYRLQWHYPMIGLPQAWDITTGSRNVTVAVIDTGVVNHRDFGANLRSDLGFDFIRSPSISVDGGGIDSNANDPGDREEADGSSSFHGTHVSGTVGAAGNNGTDVSGVAWTVNLMPLRALGRGGGTDYDIGQSIRFAAGLANDSGTVPATRADVINMSLGALAPCTSTYTAAVNAARNAGVVVVAAAGNENTSAQSTPASCAGVVSVAATDLVGQRAPYSNFGSTIDVAAPGGDASEDRDANGIADGVISTHATDETGTIVTNVQLLNGTSMASPHVAGVVALMKSVAPALTPAQFDGLLAAGVITRDLSNNGAAVRDDTYGFGLIDAFKAVGEARRLATNQQLPPAIGAAPVALDLGQTLTTGIVTVTNTGQGSLTVSGVTTTQPWLRATALQVDGNGLGTYTITIDRAGLVEASHQGQVRFASNGGTAVVPVGMRVGAERLFGDVGTLYTALVDPVTFGTGYGASSNSAAGNYPFAITGVLPGFYIVYAGTDIDNDGFICDAGEACGAFLTLADASVLELRSTTTLTAFSVLADTSLLGMVTAAGAVHVPPKGFALRRVRTGK